MEERETELAALRREIDEVDSELLPLFLRRMELSERIAAYKGEYGLPVQSETREREILERVGAEAGDRAEAAKSLYTRIFELSRARQEELLDAQASRPEASRVYGLLGRRLGHSYSPAIHRAFGCGGYRLFELEPEELETFLRRDDIAGLNVTIPYKRTVLPYCGELAGAAQAVGSVNTLVRGGDGVLRGYNTDVFGLLYAAHRADIGLAGRKVVVFGSGGASLAAQYAAASEGASSVAVISRGGPDDYDHLERHADAEVLINATPVGMYPDTGLMAADPARFPRCRGVIDMIYNPCRTALLLRAEELGIPCAGGLAMLVAQAAGAEDLFFGTHVPESEIERVIASVRRQTVNIILIGMPGSGKTTVGRELSRFTGRKLIDIDREVSREAKMTIGDIFDAEGETGFRRREHACIERFGRESGLIIATGGGAVTDGRNYAPLRQNGRLYQLERNIELLPRAGRPLSENADLAAMLRVRGPMYEHFRDKSVSNDAAPEETAAAIWRDFCENTCD